MRDIMKTNNPMPVDLPCSFLLNVVIAMFTSALLAFVEPMYTKLYGAICHPLRPSNQPTNQPTAMTPDIAGSIKLQSIYFDPTKKTPWPNTPWTHHIDRIRHWSVCIVAGPANLLACGKLVQKLNRDVLFWTKQLCTDSGGNYYKGIIFFTDADVDERKPSGLNFM